MLSRRGVLSSVFALSLQSQERTATMFGNAEAYERFMGRWSRLLAPLLIRFADIPDAGTVLDVGSGTGVLAHAVAELKRQTRVVGIDLSAEYVEFAKRKNRWPDRVKFEVSDARRLRFSEATFDNSLSLLVFNFIPQPADALREVTRVTKPRGRISAAVWDYADGMRMLRIFWDAVNATDPAAAGLDERDMPLCHAGELRELWQQGGLEGVEERPLEITMQFQSFADYWEPFVFGQGPAGQYIRKIDERRRNALRDEVKRRLKLRSDDVPFSLAARVWAVRGIVPDRA
jgi:SAM-dependent methyltransferase